MNAPHHADIKLIKGIEDYEKEEKAKVNGVPSAAKESSPPNGSVPAVVSVSGTGSQAVSNDSYHPSAGISPNQVHSLLFIDFGGGWSWSESGSSGGIKHRGRARGGQVGVLARSRIGTWSVRINHWELIRL